MLGNHWKCLNSQYILEAMNAAAAIRIPLVMSIWDDGTVYLLIIKFKLKSYIFEAL